MALIIAVTTVVACAGLAWIDEIRPVGSTDGTASWSRAAALRPLFSVGAATLSGLLGATGVWLVLQTPDTIRDRMRHALESLERLARNWFYAGEIFAFLGTPARQAARLADAFDRRLSGLRRSGHPNRDDWRDDSSRLGRRLAELDGAGTDCSTLAALLAVTGLLLALVGFGR